METQHAGSDLAALHPVAQRLKAPGPKRILSLDGGGIRGAITLGILSQLEQQIRLRHNRPEMVLADYFDLIGGTSTGSIIAASLAIGMDVASILEAYGEMGGKIFEPPASMWMLRKWLRQNLFYKNRPAAIEETLTKFFEDKATCEQITLGSPAIKCGLVVVAKRVDTFSVWPLHNNPSGKYYAQNKDIPLWRVVRASSAAPTFFPPTIFQYGQNGQVGAFIDGGVSTFNNPAMQLYLMATLQGYHFNWTAGEDQLLLVSVGTGTTVIRHSPEEVQELGKKNALFWGSTVPDLFIRDANDFNELLLQSLSHSPTSRKIDAEVGDLKEDLIAGRPMLHYLRYNVTLSQEDLKINAKHSQQDPKKFPPLQQLDDIMAMDKGQNVFHLAEIGKRHAAAQLSQQKFDAEFPRGFDVKTGS